MYFKSTVAHYELDDNGRERRELTVFLVNAQSYTEAEARTVQAATEQFRRFAVDKVVKTKISSIIDPQGADAFYLVKTKSVIFDEESAKELNSVTETMVNAQSVFEAIEKQAKENAGYLYSAEIISAALTPVTEIIEKSEDEIDF